MKRIPFSRFLCPARWRSGLRPSGRPTCHRHSAKRSWREPTPPAFPRGKGAAAHEGPARSRAQPASLPTTTAVCGNRIWHSLWHSQSAKLEAANGFEPLNGGFADLSLNHLGTPPSPFGEPRLLAWLPFCGNYPHQRAVIARETTPSRTDHEPIEKREHSAAPTAWRRLRVASWLYGTKRI